MSTRFGRQLAVASAIAALVAVPFPAAADEVGGGEIVVPEEAPAEAVVLEPVAEESCCRTVPPLGYFDDTMDAAARWMQDHKLTIGSGLSTSFVWNFNDPADHRTGLRGLNTQHSRYFVDLWQLTLANTPEPEPGDFGGLVQIDAGRIARRIKADWNGSGTVGDTQFEGHEFELQQAWIAYNIPVGDGLLLRGGKFNTLLGSEVIEPWQNANMTRSYLFSWAVPFTHTGGTLRYAFTDMVALEGGAVVGWDNFEDSNDSASALGALSLTPNDRFSLTVSGIVGPEQACEGDGVLFPNGKGCNSNYRGVVDVVAAMNPIENLDVTLEYLYGSEDKASLINPGRHAVWTGFSGILDYQILDCLSAAVRGEWFQDAQGSRLAAALADVGLEPQRLTVWEVSFDLMAKLSDTVYVRTEYRHDEADRDVFRSGKSILQAGQDAVGVELGYFF